MFVRLCSVGNPDFRQYAPLSEPEVRWAETFKEASKICREYIRVWDLGGGNWCDGAGNIDMNVGFPDPRDPILYRVSYNGRVWRVSEDGDWRKDELVYEPEGGIYADLDKK